MWQKYRPRLQRIRCLAESTGTGGQHLPSLLHILLLRLNDSQESDFRLPVVISLFAIASSSGQS